MKSLSSNYVTSYALKKMFKNKLVIIPGFVNKLGNNPVSYEITSLGKDYQVD